MGIALKSSGLSDALKDSVFKSKLEAKMGVGGWGSFCPHNPA